MPAVDELLADLTEVVGPGNVLRGSDTAGYDVDWTGRFRGHTPAVIRPASVTEVAEILRRCSGASVAVVPQGGNTGLVGGSVPHEGELVLSLRRLDRCAPVEPAPSQVTVGAGVTVGRLLEHARSAGLDYAVDLSARDSATVGGTIATNAGGMHVLRYGPTRRQLVGVEAVLADGSVVSHLGGLEKDNTGYDLASLLCGSEGTLGVVTAARVRLVRARAHRVVALLGFTEVAAAIAGGLRLRNMREVEAAELFLDAGVRLVCEALGLSPPLSSMPPVYLLVEAAADVDPTQRLAAEVQATSAIDVAVAEDHERRRALWRYREAHTEAINTLGPPHKLDVTLPIDQLAEFSSDVTVAVDELAPRARCWLFGHALDGNLHVNVSGLGLDDDRVDGLVLSMVAARGGSISAEHGIGVAKKRWLHLSRSDEELAAFRSIKTALDPEGILNPNVLLPPATPG